MQVSQTVKAGQLTGSWISYDGSLQLTFGEDEVRCQISEDQLRELSGRLAKRVNEIDEQRKEKENEESDAGL